MNGVDHNYFYVAKNKEYSYECNHVICEQQLDRYISKVRRSSKCLESARKKSLLWRSCTDDDANKPTSHILHA